MRVLHLLLTVCLISLFATALFASAGTDIVANKGQPAYVSEHWPEGIKEIVNDPSRTTGWNDWFSEWPNDVNHYAMEIHSTDDLNRLIEKLATVKSEVREIHLSYQMEPRGLGWVTQLPAGNKIPVIFSLGDQHQIDEWYKHVRKPFGVMEFTAAPIAVPPTLTIFVQNPLIDLDKLNIPNGMTVIAGHLPGVFHRSNTTIEKEQLEKAKTTPPVAQKLDAGTQATFDRITKYIEKRQQVIDLRQKHRIFR